MSKKFLPGSVIGIMGGGQLGRMFTIEAKKMGYHVHIFSPETNSPAGQIADKEIVASYEDKEAVEAFARTIDVLTFEFENIPIESVEWCAPFCEIRPSGKILHIAQNRLREKEFLAGAGLPLPKFRKVTGLQDLEAAVGNIGRPSVLKSAAFGYDGKGQRKITEESDLDEVWSAFEGQVAVLEQFVPYVKEISALVARGVDGTVEVFPIVENLHRNHILDFSIVPARIEKSVEQEAKMIAVAVAEKLELVGLLAIEMFLLEKGEILINEIAPRPHNSGHFSFDASVTSQFEQQLRAITGLPLGSPESVCPAVMANLLGDVWEKGEPDWETAASFRNVKIHLYGKSEPRKGRKMGHLVALAPNVEEAVEMAKTARDSLTKKYE